MSHVLQIRERHRSPIYMENAMPLIIVRTFCTNSKCANCEMGPHPRIPIPKFMATQDALPLPIIKVAHAA